jgi:enterochelin esterase-like enzyme
MRCLPCAASMSADPRRSAQNSQPLLGAPRPCCAAAVLASLTLQLGCAPRAADNAPGSAGRPTARPFACPSIAHELQQLDAATDPARKRALVDALVDRARAAETPLLGPGTPPELACATFLYRGSARDVTLAGDMNGWDPARNPLTRVADTDLFFLSLQFPADARLDYKLVSDGQWLLDPLNPRTMPGGYGPNSQAMMPRYVPPPEIERYADLPHGTIETVTWSSQRLKDERRMLVYLPPGYASSAARYPVVYLHDGQAELNYAKLDNVLDYLIDKRTIPPVIAVLVPPVNREAEYATNPAYEEFFVEEVVARTDRAYRTQAAPPSRAIGGISYGGVAALSLALHRPDVFGNCMAQSSGGLANELTTLRALIREAPRRDVAFYLDVGTLEEFVDGTEMLGANRQLRDDLTARGYRLRYQEVPEGHSWGNWRARRDDALAFFWHAERPRP